ncbi:Lipid A export ATP-binding/permease protein MsbA [Limihaloglobus sulfuriphilus]|uniref:Lipid A export ATP-binding/permease protein MsbA n=1 Tax=Limihaloglobus sulfuriphilus TaxID=1851148 RepID=A0A1Q2MCS8_9BACT|nr:ABC transporter ATP-binding protein [Limihaloglobus sulfuriphilus]AQQ70464.1 Lipid A export ATP-binding/permease protein MsbA [Limihaloglobus sulfuriphilus]
MKPLKRLLDYVWPQWPRLAVLGVCVIVIAVFTAASFLTIIPLLKTMMSREGIHGWVDSKLCETRYGMDLYMPDVIDISSDENLAYFLTVISVEDDSAADLAGIEPGDSIVKAADGEHDAEARMTSARMLEILSRAPENRDIELEILRKTPDGHIGRDPIKISMDTSKVPFYYGTVVSLMNYVTRENSEKVKIRAIQLVLLFALAATMFRCVARFFQDYIAHKIVNIALNLLRNDCYKHILRMPESFFDKQGRTDFASRLVKDTEAAGAGVKVLLTKAIREPAKAIATLAAALLLHWQIVVVFLLASPFVGIVVQRLGKKIKKATRRSLVEWSNMLTKIEDTTTGLRAVKVYNKQGYENIRFQKINSSLLKQQMKIAKITAATSPLLEILGMIAGLFALLFALNYVIEGHLEPEKFFTLIILLGTSAESVRKSSNTWNRLQESNAAISRVFHILDSPLEKDCENPKKLKGLKESIEFRNISFAYPASETNVLNNLNLSIKVGSKVAIVGHNGSGKTTLLNLLPRFYDPQSGQVLFDGQDISKVSLAELRSKIAVVSQKTITFNDTIFNNIAYGKDNATEQEVIEAAQQAYAHEFIDILPDKYNSFIGQDGAGLSGGQLQRIVIARAILKKPQILIFDEAMSQVDADSESKIYKALEEMTHDRTSFVIAHRFSTVVNSDLIIVMKDGSIEDQGSHEDLMQRSDTYRKLYTTQLL